MIDMDTEAKEDPLEDSVQLEAEPNGQKVEEPRKGPQLKKKKKSDKVILTVSVPSAYW